MKKKASMKLPETVYVQVHEDIDGDYLIAEDAVEKLEEAFEAVGVYQLFEVKKFKVERKLV